MFKCAISMSTAGSGCRSFSQIHVPKLKNDYISNSTNSVFQVYKIDIGAKQFKTLIKYTNTNPLT